MNLKSGKVMLLPMIAIAAFSSALLIPPRAAAQPFNFQISPTSFDFGSEGLNATTPPQIVSVINVSSSPQTINMTGGGAGVFGGSQNCQGGTLDPGESCQIFYRYTPSQFGLVNGSTNGTINGQSFSFGFRGYAPGASPADLNGDGFVDGLDLGILLGNFNSTAAPNQGELNGTPPVDGLDLGILLGAWNPPLPPMLTSVPEPAAAGLTLLGLLAFLSVRRRI